MSFGRCSHEKRDELTGSDQNQRQQNEGSEAMADDGEGSSEAQMQNQDGADVGFPMENRSEIFEPDHLEAADEAEEDADEEEDGSSVEP